ncbi:MAG: glycosyltransferase family protein [Spirosomataceae bacterium]
MSKFLFIIQGEGRGHLTQAISLAQILRANGHEVAVGLVGIGKGRPLPAFFTQVFPASVVTFRSPHLVFSRRGISFSKTIIHHLFRFRHYLKSLRHIHAAVQSHRPDVIINFYEVLGGMYALIYRPSVPIVAVGHHYLFLRSDFTFPAQQGLDRWLLKINTHLTAIRAGKLLALSFYPTAGPAQGKIITVPPLLREAVKTLETGRESYLLAYITYASMSKEIIEWHLQHPEVRLHCFWENPPYDFDDTLTFHKVDGAQFLQMMAHCTALATTAGFESVCEAMYLGKPVLMVPAHYEQACNALDAQRAGAGVVADRFDLSLLLDYLLTHTSSPKNFQQWCWSANDLFLHHLEEVASSQTSDLGLENRVDAF